MARQVTGLDLGSYSVKVVRLQIRGKHQADWSCEFDEEIIAFDRLSEDPEARKKAEIAALEALRVRGMMNGEIFITALPPGQAQMRFLEVPFTSERKVTAVLGGILESQIPLNIDSLVYPWTRVGAVSTSSAANGYTILVGFAPKLGIQQHLSTLQSVGVSPSIVNFKALALRELSPTSEGSTSVSSDKLVPVSCNAIIDLGHRSTSICISNSAGVVVARVLLRGMADLFTDVAKSLNIEAAKVQDLMEHGYGLVELGEQSSKDEIAWRNALLHGLNPIVIDIRQSLLAIKTQGDYHLQGCYLVGGGAKMKNLVAYLSETLAFSVFLGAPPRFKQLELQQNHSFALAGALALQGLSLSEKANRLNFRWGEFSFRGQQTILKGRTGALIGWGVALFVLLLINFSVQKLILGRQAAAVIAEQQKSCDAVEKDKVFSAKKCLMAMREQLASSRRATVSNFSAVDAYLELSRVLPADLSVKIADLDISQGILRIQGTTTSFEVVDKIVVGLAKGRCFSEVQKGRAAMQGKEVSFAVSVTLKCDGMGKERSAS